MGTRVLDDVWRLTHRFVPHGLHPVIDGRECYVFQRLGDKAETSSLVQTHFVPVETFWNTP